jgi:hypothetical protein
MIENRALRIISVVDPHMVGFAPIANIYVKVDPQCLESSLEQIMKF